MVPRMNTQNRYLKRILRESGYSQKIAGKIEEWYNAPIKET